MRLIKAIRRACLLFIVWSIEQHIRDLQQVMRETNNIHHYQLAMREVEIAKRELATARKEYSALLPVGVRRTWKTA